MEIPLVLRASGPAKLVYELPLWYRMIMALIAAAIAGSILVSGGAPSPFGWFILIVAIVAAIYEERWTFDSAEGVAVQRTGLLVLAKRTILRLSEVEKMRILPYVRGTIPGSEDELAENAAALSGGRTDDGGRRRAVYKRPFLNLVIACVDGRQLLVNTVAARKKGALVEVAQRIAAHCGKQLVEG
jgi:hypothetical protein